MIGIAPGLRPWPRAAFLGGLGLSACAALILVLAMYFADTAPRLPGTAAALETLGTGGTWPSVVTARSLDRSAPVTAEVLPRNLNLSPRAAARSEARPIDASDLPPRDLPIR